MANSKVAIGETVVVEGSLSPAVGYLKRGEKAEVAYSENVADLHRKGFIIVKGKPSANPVTPGVPVAPDQTIPSVSFEKPDQTVPSVPSGTNQDLVDAAPPAPAGNPVTPTVPQGTDQGLVEATPVAPEPAPEPNPDVDNGLVEVANPDVDNSLVDVNAKPASATTRTTAKK
jgi:hypothetical protein